MKRHIVMLALAGLFVVFAAQTASAAVPPMINYQGILNSNGGPVISTVAVVFTIYDALAGGNVLWTETRDITPDADGRFDVLLGEVNPLGETAFSGADRWLGVRVGSDAELGPRTRLTSVGYSHVVATVHGAKGGIISDSLTVAGTVHIASGGLKFPDGTVQFTQAGASNGLPEGGGTMTGPIVSVGDPPITMGKGSFGSGNSNSGANAFVAGESDTASGDYCGVASGFGNVATGENTDTSDIEYNMATDIYSGQSMQIPGAGGYSFIGGGLNNHADGKFSFVGGGYDNWATGVKTTVGGGERNQARGTFSLVVGGLFNIAYRSYSTIGGGWKNRAGDNAVHGGSYATIGGGQLNTTLGNNSTIGGGIRNVIEEHADSSTIAGGSRNLTTATAGGASIGGGVHNSVSGNFATVPGGTENSAAGSASFAAGQRAKAEHDNTFVWNDGTQSDFVSRAANQFLIRASGGVGIGTEEPSSALDVVGTVTMTGLKLPPDAGEGLVLTSDEFGVGTWRPATGGSGWTDDGTVVRLTDINDRVGIGTITPNEQLEITGNLQLPLSTASAGVIKSDGVPFIHNFGTNNTFVGRYAGNLTLTGSDNTASGHRALQTNTTGYRNTADGTAALVTNSTGWNNTASGYHALYGNTTGSSNTADGTYALAFNTTGNQNTAIGTAALVAISTGSYNTAIGYQADTLNSTGSYNTAIGYKAGASGSDLTNSTAIGANALVSASNSLVLGGTGGNAVNVGIGTPAPTEALHVVGNIRIDDGAAVAGYVLTANDATGLASWQAASGGAAFLPLAGGTMTGPITSVGNPSITMGKGNFGSGNTNTGTDAFVAGWSCSAGGRQATISGGDHNTANGDAATVGGGQYNTANRVNAVIGGGTGNVASGQVAAICGGTENTASGNESSVGGGGDNTAGGQFSTVGGGLDNISNGTYSTIGGGGHNRARGLNSVVAGGGGGTIADSNSANGNYSAVGGGTKNAASGLNATVGGGSTNTASGIDAVVPGGNSNTAGGQSSFAAGYRAKTTMSGSFLWADFNPFDFPIAADPNVVQGVNQFLVRATGPVGGGTAAEFVSAIDGTGNATNGVRLASGGGAWAVFSDRNAKEEYASVDGEKLLQKLAEIPIETWKYKAQPSSIRHIGPTAQDFYAAFGVGEDDKHITTIDADGVALAAIQALYGQQKTANEQLRRQVAANEDLRAQIAELREMIRALAGGQK